MMKLTITEISVHSEKENPIFGEIATHVKLDDEGGGLYIKLIQYTDTGTQEIKLDFNEIEPIINAINILRNNSTNNSDELFNILTDEQKQMSLNFKDADHPWNKEDQHKK